MADSLSHRGRLPGPPARPTPDTVAATSGTVEPTDDAQRASTDGRAKLAAELAHQLKRTDLDMLAVDLAGTLSRYDYPLDITEDDIAAVLLPFLEGAIQHQIDSEFPPESSND